MWHPMVGSQYELWYLATYQIFCAESSADLQYAIVQAVQALLPRRYCRGNKVVSDWRGFLAESKSYMNYPDHWPERNHAGVLEGGWTMADKKHAKVEFWLAFPRAWVRFYSSTVLDWIRHSLRG